MDAPKGYMTLKDASKYYNINYNALLEATHSGELKARVRRGTTRPFLVNKEIMEEWLDNGFIRVTSALKRGGY